MIEDLQVVEVKEKVNADWCSIFNTYDFFNLHRTDSSFYLALTDTSTGAVEGVCHFTETEKGIFKSPRRGTFGGFELRENNIEYLITFVKQAEEFLKQKSASRVIISAAPFQHNVAFSAHLFNTLFNNGYNIGDQEINYGVTVDGVELIEKMNRNNKKRLKKCLRDGFAFEQVFSEEQFNIVYEIIAVNRQNKGYPLTMTFEQVMEMKQLFSDNVYFFKATQNNVDVASSICIRLNKEVFYVFYWGDIPGYEQHSPICFVADGIYKFAQQNNFKLVDAGISTANGVPNFGLIKFKENLGFTESLRVSYIKNL